MLKYIIHVFIFFASCLIVEGSLSTEEIQEGPEKMDQGETATLIPTGATGGELSLSILGSGEILAAIVTEDGAESAEVAEQMAASVIATTDYFAYAENSLIFVQALPASSLVLISDDKGLTGPMISEFKSYEEDGVLKVSFIAPNTAIGGKVQIQHSIAADMASFFKIEKEGLNVFTILRNPILERNETLSLTIIVRYQNGKMSNILSSVLPNNPYFKMKEVVVEGEGVDYWPSEK